MKKRKFYFIFLIIAIMILSSCGSQPEQPASNSVIILSVEEAEEILRSHFNNFDEPLSYLIEYDKFDGDIRLYCFSFPGDVSTLEFVNSITGEITQEPVPWLEEMMRQFQENENANKAETLLDTFIREREISY